MVSSNVRVTMALVIFTAKETMFGEVVSGMTKTLRRLEVPADPVAATGVPDTSRTKYVENLTQQVKESKHIVLMYFS